MITKDEKKLIYQALLAVAEGPFFPEWEFQTLIGVERNEIKLIISNWDTVDFSDQKTIDIISSSIANLSGYPHGKDDEIGKYLSVSPENVLDIVDKIDLEKI